MYRSLYNLDSRPFEVKPDPGFLWLGEKHREAFSVLRYGILDNKGFLLLTGGVGTGKTILINGLTQNLKEDVTWAVIDDPVLERIDFYNAIAGGFGLEKQFTSKVQFLIQFSHFLHNAHDDGQKVLLLVDNCHLLSQDMLEELRLLSNIEKADAKLINIFFVGRPAFNDMLVQPRNRAVRQRLTLRTELMPLDGGETTDYITHRLKTAGAGARIFTAKAIKSIFKYSHGVPRRINIICDHALVVGSVQGKSIIDHKMIATCIQKLNLPANPSWEDFERLAGKKGQLKKFSETLTAETPLSQSGVTKFNLEADKRRSWLVYALPCIVLFLLGMYFWYPWQQPAEIAGCGIAEESWSPASKDMSQIGSSPVVVVLGENENEIGEQKATELKNVILENAYNHDMKMLSDKENIPTERVIERPLEIAETAEEEIEESVKYEPEEDGSLQEGEDLEGWASQSEVVVVEKTVTVQADGTAEEQEAKELIVTKEIVTVVVVAPPESVIEPEKKSAAQLVSLEREKIVLSVLPNSLKLTRAASKKFDKFIDELTLYSGSTLLVKGFVSSTSNSLENIQLSEDRAENVQKLLVSRGVDAGRIQLKGMGNQEPLASNNSAAGRRKNRRVEISVIDVGTVMVD